LLGLLVQVSLAQDEPKAPAEPAKAEETKAPPPQATAKGVTLDTSETLFTVLAAINACGYDYELSISDPLRAIIRGQVAAAIQASADAQAVTQAMCDLYKQHEASDASHTLAEYVSLALYLTPPPELALRVKEADLPPDSVSVVGIVPSLQKWYEVVNLHEIWEQHLGTYQAIAEGYHAPLSNALFGSEMYLRMPSSAYPGRGFTVLIDPMGPPGQTNARNYGSDYYVVISPGQATSLKIEQVRHTYLHYLLDPLVLGYPSELKRIEPLLPAVKNAPMDESFKSDVSLLATECLIRAVEAHLIGSSKTPESEREQAVQRSVRQGYILTPYFYQGLAKFEKEPTGLRNAYSAMLSGINVGKEVKQAAQVHFAATADPDVMRLARPSAPKLLVTAEQHLVTGDVAAARQLAQQALDEKREDPGRALFILAQAAIMNRDLEGAQSYFQRALGATREPKVLAWSHIYLGRICDMQEDREAALGHYRAALNAGAALPEAKAAAEKGMQQPYEPHSQRQ
jgi:hypothetical protein